MSSVKKVPGPEGSGACNGGPGFSEIDCFLKKDDSTKVCFMMVDDVRAVADDYFSDSFPLRFARAGKFRLEGDRLRCLGVAWLLREKLGLVESDLKAGEFGKLYSDKIEGDFSISHAGDYVVLAVSDRPVGVDIESMASLENPDGESGLMALGEQVFTAEELKWIFADCEGEQGCISRINAPDDWAGARCAAGGSSGARCAAGGCRSGKERFLRLWTLKESILKAAGLGMNMDFKSFSVLPLVLSEGERALELDGNFYLCKSEVEGGYCLSVAVGQRR